MGGDDSQGKNHWMYYFYCTCFYLHCCVRLADREVQRTFRRRYVASHKN